MDRLPSLDLLNATHTFPCSYTFKVIGHVDGDFVDRVVAAVRDGLDEGVDPPYRLRQTSNGRQVSVTLNPDVQTADQVLAVYERIRTLDGLIVLW